MLQGLEDNKGAERIADKRNGARAQDALGETMDASVALTWLQDSTAALRLAGADPFELGLLTGAELQRLAHGVDDGYEVMARLAQRFEDHSS